MMNYMAKIKAKVSIFTRKKTSSIFDGSYKSVYTGNGFDFESLREYIPGDSIRDIDWKASSRSRKVLVKRYIAQKKHNIMLVFDTGKKFLADTKGMQLKKDVALSVGGTVGYLTCKNGDDVGAIYCSKGMICYHPVKGGLYNVEKILTEYDKEDFSQYNSELEKSLHYIIKNVRRKMILFVITDMAGIKNIEEDTIKKLTYQHDVLFIDVSDADVTCGKSYDVNKALYIPDFISQNKYLKQIEEEMKKKILEENTKKLLKYRIVSTQVDSEEEIIEKVIELLERHKYANNR